MIDIVETDGAVQNEERQVGEGFTSCIGKLLRYMEEGEGIETAQIGCAGIGTEDTVGTSTAYTGSHRKRKCGLQIKSVTNTDNTTSLCDKDIQQISSSMDERSPTGNFIANHIIIGHPGFQVKDENRPKGMKL